MITSSLWQSRFYNDDTHAEPDRAILRAADVPLASLQRALGMRAAVVPPDPTLGDVAAQVSH